MLPNMENSTLSPALICTYRNTTFVFQLVFKSEIDPIFVNNAEQIIKNQILNTGRNLKQ